MSLPHRHRQSRRPTAVQLAEARIAIPFGAAFDVLVPQHRQGDVLALELAVNLSPIGLDVTPMALLGAGGSKQRRLQRGVGHLSRQWPAQPGSRQSLQRQPDRRRRKPYSTGDGRPVLARGSVFKLNQLSLVGWIMAGFNQLLLPFTVSISIDTIVMALCTKYAKYKKTL